jgi:hypothetical protein
MAFLVPRATAELLQAGPFISSADGVTPLETLIITPAQRRLSVNGAAFVTTTDTGNAASSTEGYYSFLVTAVDLATLGTSRVIVAVPEALPVWLDLIVVAPLTHQTLGAVQSSPILQQAVPMALTMGPFVSRLDGITLLNTETIPPTEILLSANDGPFAPTTGAANATPLGHGHYSIALTDLDTAVLGTLRTSIDLEDALPVWLDVVVVDATTYAFYFQGIAPPAVVLPPPVQVFPPPPAPLLGGMEPSLVAMLTETVTHAAYYGQDLYGKPVYSEAVQRPARIQYEVTVVNVQGQERTSTTTVYFNGDFPLTVRDKVILPDGQAPAIQSIASPRDMQGQIYHHKVFL